MAACLPRAEALDQFRSWFDALLHHGYADCDVYVGLNPSACQDLALANLGTYGKSFASLAVAVVDDPKRVVSSDVSGYQKGLELLYRSNKTYDVVWMVHTKGISYEVRSTMWKNALDLQTKVLGSRERVERSFASNPNLGSWTPYLTVCAAHREDFDAYFDFTYRVMPLFCVYTFAALRGSALHAFLNEASKRGFFEDNLPASAGFKESARWFFEFAMAQIVWRQGYDPSYDALIDWNFWNKTDQPDLLLPQPKLEATEHVVQKLIRMNRANYDPVEAADAVRKELLVAKSNNQKGLLKN